MEIFVLDQTSYSRLGIVEPYQSFIWTERWNVYGDFQLVVDPTDKMKELLTPGRYISIRESTRLMLIETVNQGEDTTGVVTLTITGRDAIILFDNRGLLGGTGALSYANTSSRSTMVGLIGTVCILGTAPYTYDTIPLMEAVNPVAADPDVFINYTVTAKSLYAALVELAPMSNNGIHVDLKHSTYVSRVDPEIPSAPHLRFTTEYGINYSGQIANGVYSSTHTVIFSTLTDTLTSPSYLLSNASQKNIAYVTGQTATITVAAPGVDPHIAAPNRRVLAVDATDISPTGLSGAAYNALLTQRGLTALAATPYVSSFDGELPASIPYTYGVDFKMGDIVALQGILDTDFTPQRITEWIFASDNQGERSYPTLTSLTTDNV